MNLLKFVSILTLTGAVLEVRSSAVNGLPPATLCDEQKCKLPDCRCSTSSIPGNLALNDTPQFVFLTFDDAVNDLNFDLYSQILFNRKNPDGCNVSATTFLSHEYTNYPMVRQLYEYGFEIALHSITHREDVKYWKNATVELLKEEFGGERKLISYFAKLDENEFLGMRLPLLQLSGNNSFEALKELELKYDCSWPSRDFVNPGLWPYTLDYLSVQNCDIGPCPTASIPGAWVVPMLDWLDKSNNACAMSDACVSIPTDSNGILKWMQENFNRNYYKNKAPFGIYIHSPWLADQTEHVKAYTSFIDYLQTLDDVFIVGIGRALDWIQHPVPIGSVTWPACPKVKKVPCGDKACKYTRDDGSDIYMQICSDIQCPPHYPSLDNPFGK